jgi:hypothetical protein
MLGTFGLIGVLDLKQPNVDPRARTAKSSVIITPF